MEFIDVHNGVIRKVFKHETFKYKYRISIKNIRNVLFNLRTQHVRTQRSDSVHLLIDSKNAEKIIQKSLITYVNLIQVFFREIRIPPKLLNNANRPLLPVTNETFKRHFLQRFFSTYIQIIYDTLFNRVRNLKIIKKRIWIIKWYVINCTD